MLAPELIDLFGRGLLAEDGDRRIARHEFDQQSDERDDRPHNEQQDQNSPRDLKQPVLHLQGKLRSRISGW